MFEKHKMTKFNVMDMKPLSDSCKDREDTNKNFSISRPEMI